MKLLILGKSISIGKQELQSSCYSHKSASGAIVGIVKAICPNRYNKEIKTDWKKYTLPMPRKFAGIFLKTLATEN